jgi:hypothetical protein
METESIGSSFMNAFLIVGAILILGLGIWLGIKYGTPTPPPPPPPSSPSPSPDVPVPVPSQRDHHPAVDPGPPIKPAPPKPFTPHLKLKQAVYNPASREIKIDFIVDANTPIPVTRTYSTNFFVELDGKPVTSISENEPLHQTDIGFVKETILETTGVPLETKSSQLAVKAQLNYYASDGTTGVFGTPQTIRVS